MAAVVATGTRVAAGPLADALARHGAADIAALRTQLASADARCTLGAIYAKTGDLPRAALFLDGCDETKLDPDIADSVARAAAEVGRALRASQLSAISIDSVPPGLVVTTDALPGETITAPATVWARAGTYMVRDGPSTGTMIHVEPHSRTSVVLGNSPPPTAQQSPPRTHTIDFLDEPTDPANSGPPPAQKHPSLLPCKFDGCDTHGGETLDDPFALRAAALPGFPRLAAGVHVGTSAAFHDGGDRIAPTVAIDGRVRVGRVPGIGPAVIAARLDWSRRIATDGDFDAWGADVEAGVVIAQPDAAWLTVLAGVRGEVHAPAVMDVGRSAAGFTAAFELALRSLPVTAGVRYDQELGAGEAVLLEIGVEGRR